MNFSNTKFIIAWMRWVFYNKVFFIYGFVDGWCKGNLGV